MKLIDFKSNNMFNKVREDMKIKKGYFAKYDGSIKRRKLSLKEIEFEQIENGVGLEVDLNNLEFGNDNEIIYKGEKVILYIKNQYSYDTEYKFHVAWCKTLRSMRANNRFNRYVISRRTDGRFYVNMYDSESKKLREENILRELKVCKNCLNELNYKGYSEMEYGRKNNIYSKFSLEEYLKFNETHIPYRPKDIEEVNEYPENWKNISWNYRSFKKWKCEKCGLDCSTNKGYLDVHHMDGRKNNSSYNNLKALCKKCHSKEYMHSHYDYLK